MNWKRTAISAALAASGLAASALPALADDPVRPTLREGKADFTDKELAVFYAFNPGTLDFAFTDFLSVGVSTDQVFSPHNWGYRATWKLLNNADAGLAIAANAEVLQTRERLAGDVYNPPVWGYQGGFLVSLATESGLIFRCGFQLYDTDWSTSTGQQFLLSPEIAYRWNIVEIAVTPSWPLSLNEFNWVGIRLRI